MKHETLVKVTWSHWFLLDKMVSSLSKATLDLGHILYAPYFFYEIKYKPYLLKKFKLFKK